MLVRVAGEFFHTRDTLLLRVILLEGYSYGGEDFGSRRKIIKIGRMTPLVSRNPPYIHIISFSYKFRPKGMNFS